jgi:hypothetical protein
MLLLYLSDNSAVFIPPFSPDDEAAKGFTSKTAHLKNMTESKKNYHFLREL